MFASQLLRILQTIPSDVKYDTRVFDISEQDLTMKEKQKTTLFDAQSFGREADPLALESKEIYHVNGSKRVVTPLAFEIKRGDESWNPFLDDYSMATENGTQDSPKKENQKVPLYCIKDADSLSSDTNDKDKMGVDEISMKLGELTHSDEIEYRDSSLSRDTASDLCEADMNSYTDKNVLEPELPEVEVCYKEINYHIVKDICVDDGMSEKDRKNSIGSSQDDQSDLSLSGPPIESNHSEATDLGVDMEFVVSDGVTDSLSVNNKDATEDEHGDMEQSDGNLIYQGTPKLLPETSSAKDSVESRDSQDSAERIGETNDNAISNAVMNASEEESFVDRKLPIQEFGTRSFLRSFMSSFDSAENEVALMPSQMPFEKSPSGDPAAASTGQEPKDPEAASTEQQSNEDVKTTSLVYNSKNVESGAITFNFNPPAPVVDGITTERAEDAKEQLGDSENLHDHQGLNPDNLSDITQVQCTINNENCTGKNPQEQSRNAKDENSSDSSATIQIPCVSSNDENQENVQKPHIDTKPDDLSGEGQVQFPNTEIENFPNNNGKAVVTNISKHERRNSSNVSDLVPLQRDAGESSFSAGLITYSGRIAYSGSLSVRSDGSTASGKSFAFPILPNEWDSSPVRMAKADRRHFRKHKCWKSGFLCCRF